MQPLAKTLDFLLYDVLGTDELFERELYQEHERAVADSILDTARRIAEDVLAPHNAKGDANEPHFDGEHTTLIPETKLAWDTIAEAGFMAAPHAPAHGGLGLPETITRAAMVFFNAANVATSGYPFLTIGAANLIAAFGSEAQRDTFLAPMMDGRSSGTMALSEPAQGSSLADITTLATPQADGSYKLRGQKIYISGGDHDLTENIIHMVLAKIEGAPAGVKGISLFICPKVLVNPDGTLGARNDVVLAGLLHKMGYRNTTSAVLSFGEQDNCSAYLLGEPHKGLSYMFQMMNEARIGVGLGAAALGWAGYAYSLKFARERKQGRRVTNKNPHSEQVGIIQHADVRRMLLAQKSYAEGSLTLCLYASRLVDDERSANTLAARERAHELLDFLTPVVKSWPSKYGPKANDLAIQVLGGSGYIREYPVEQFYRDNRLNPIHEGTEGIQGLDLLGRKLPMMGGKLYEVFQDELCKTIYEAKEVHGDLASALESYLSRHKSTSHTLLDALQNDPELALANATEYLDFTGRLVVGWMWLKVAVAASQKLAKNPSQAAFYRGKLQAARYHFEWELPQMHAQADLLDSLNRTPLDMREEWF